MLQTRLENISSQYPFRNTKLDVRGQFLESHQVQFQIDLKFAPPDVTLFAPSSGNNPDQGLFFYHLDKTAGTTVTMALRGMAFGINRPAHIFSGKYGRNLIAPPPAASPGKVWLGAGHAVYPFHELVMEQCSLFTVVRHPVSRVVSKFFWTFRNDLHGNLVSKFEKFLTETDTHNHQAVSIKEPDAFKYLCTVDEIEPALGHLFANNSAPALVVRNGKVTKHQMAAELEERFGDSIAELNTKDMDLFELARKRVWPKTVRPEPQDVTLAVTPLSLDQAGLGKASAIVDLKRDQLLLAGAGVTEQAHPFAKISAITDLPALRQHVQSVSQEV